MGEVRLTDIRAEPLSIDEVVDAVADLAAGGVTTFTGAVRAEADGRPVTGLRYEAHPDAAATLRRIATEVAATPGVRAVAATHRTGELTVGEVSVVVAASAGHRQEAFAAARTLIDRLKAEVPIWKQELFADGASHWVGTPGERTVSSPR
jgi:molybdopterin synthase catalytic subunit